MGKTVYTANLRFVDYWSDGFVFLYDTKKENVQEILGMFTTDRITGFFDKNVINFGFVQFEFDVFGRKYPSFGFEVQIEAKEFSAQGIYQFELKEEIGSLILLSEITNEKEIELLEKNF